MARKLMLSLSMILMIACQKPAEQVEAAAPVRETIAIRYVAVPSLEVHASADETSEILSKYSFGETVSVYAVEGDWSEVAVGLASSGWVQTNALADDRNSVTSTASEPRFHQPPMPVVSPSGITGEILLEASVNTSGEVTEVRTMSNTTGSKALAEENIKALKKASFFPMIINGKLEPFVYEYRVTY